MLKFAYIPTFAFIAGLGVSAGSSSNAAASQYIGDVTAPAVTSDPQCTAAGSHIFGTYLDCLIEDGVEISKRRPRKKRRE